MSPLSRFFRRFAAPVHAPDCPGAKGTRRRRGCGGTFICVHCGRRVGWCCGAHDDLPDHCDECWVQVHHQRDAAPISVGSAS